MLNHEPQQQKQQQDQQLQLEQEQDSPTSACACKALLQDPGTWGEDDLYEDSTFPRVLSDDSLQPSENGEKPSEFVKGLLWVRPDEIVQRIHKQQSKAQRASRPQQQQQPQEQSMQQEQAEKTAILFSNNRIASTVAQGILPSHAFAGAASGLAASNPRVIREALVHPQEWRARGIFCAAFFRSGEREVVSVDTRLPCRLAQQPKEHNRRSRCASRSGGSENRKIRSSTRKGTIWAGATQPANEGSIGNTAAAGADVKQDAAAGQESPTVHSNAAKQKNIRNQREPAETQAGCSEPAIDFAFSHCHAFEEVWLPLLEKAYAKFLGSYEAVAQR